MNSMQLELFAPLSITKTEERSAFSDPSFGSNKNLPIHRWIPWIAGFSSHFVREIIENHLPEKGTVLDPFAGVGTTLVEAVFGGHNGIGFEINPYAALACQIKTNVEGLKAQEIRLEMAKLRQFYSDASSENYCPSSVSPSGFKTRTKFYSPAVLKKVLLVHDFISQLKNRQNKDVFRLAFASTMIQYSNYSYEPSLGTRKAAGKSDIEDFPVLDVILEKLNQIASDLEWVARNTRTPSSKTRIIHSSFLESQKYLDPASIDLVITSPPYLNNYHYIRNTRPHLYWLGFAEKPNDTKTLEQQNFGKYWQTVRELAAVNLNFPEPPIALSDQINLLRTLNRERGIYGGNGWANYAASYFNDCYRFVQMLRYVLKPGSSAFIVIGNSILQGVAIPTDIYLSRIAESVGIEVVQIATPRTTRVGNSIIKSDVRAAKAEKSHRLYESVIELRQPK